MLQQRMTRWASIGGGLTILLAGCGASTSEPSVATGASSAPAAPATQGVSAPPDASADAPATSQGTGSGTGTPNTAVVVIGDQRYEFSDVQCSIFAPRYIQAGNFGGDPEVSIVLPPEGWESEGETYSPPSVTVKVGDEGTGQRWVAGDDGYPLITPIPAGSSQIDSYTVPDGRPVTATGTATFIDLEAHNRGDDAPSATGSFEVSCP